MQYLLYQKRYYYHIHIKPFEQKLSIAAKELVYTNIAKDICYKVLIMAQYMFHNKQIPTLIPHY
jgi:hypothetical protein